jgi:hypothetical protein
LENKRAHLVMVQGVINRMGSNSFFLKGWTITLVAALSAVAIKESDRYVLYVAYFPTIAFWALDGYYLWQEKLFRKLYEIVAQTNEDDVDFKMDVSKVSEDVKTLIAVMFSPTVSVFYGAVLLSIFLLFMLSR